MNTLNYIDEPILIPNKVERLKKYFNKMDKFILYHATTDKFKEQILKKGILPRSKTGNSVYEGKHIENKNLESEENQVYVGNFITARHLGLTTVSKYGGNLIIFQTIIKYQDLYPDEDSNATTGIESLAKMGSASLKKSIKPEEIIGFTYNTIIGDEGNLKMEPNSHKKIESILFAYPNMKKLPF